MERVKRYKKIRITSKVPQLSLGELRRFFHRHWSDSDYHTTEKSGRSYYDNGLPLADEYLDLIVSVPSVEDKLFQKLRSELKDYI